MKVIDDAHAALMAWHADPAVNRDYTVSVGDTLATALEAVLTVYEEEHQARQNITDGLLRSVSRQSQSLRAHREIRARLAAEDVPIHVSADIEQILCETGGDFGTGHGTVEVESDLRERVAEILDNAHGPQITEGGCDFRAWVTPSFGQQGAGWIDPVIDQVIAEVRLG
jgi:hypothetical protein